MKARNLELDSSARVNAQHSTKSVEHYTPRTIVEAARRALGGRIDLDPASSTLANRTVGARRIFTELDNGLAQPWHGNVLMNPPGGRLKNKSMQCVWWRKCYAEWLARRVDAVVVIAFSIELLQNAQGGTSGELTPLDFPFCVPRKRIAFCSPDGDTVVQKTSPTHANAIVFLPNDAPGSIELFCSAFEAIGQVVVPAAKAWSRRR